MSDLVIDYAQTHLGDRASVLIDAHRALMNQGFEDHIVAIEQIITYNDELDPFEVESRIESTVGWMIERELMQHAIVLNHTDLRILPWIYRTLVELEDTDELEYYHALLEEGDTPESTLAELVGTYWDMDPTDIEPVLNDVDASLIERMKTVLVEAMDRRSVIEDQRPSYKTLYRFIHRENVRCMNQLLKEESYQPGYSFENYWRGIIEKGNNCSDIAREYIAACLAANESLETMLNHAEERLDGYTEDIMELNRVLQAIRQIYTQFEQESS